MDRKHAAIALTVLCAGCASPAALGASTSASTGGGAPGAAACAGSGQATKATVLRAMHLLPATPIAQLEHTDTDRAQVQALFADLCAVVTHPAPSAAYNCPDDVGIGWAGTFYDGGQVLATFSYAISGCQRITLTTGRSGTTLVSIVAGSAAQAAPALEPDFARVVGMPQDKVFLPDLGG